MKHLLTAVISLGLIAAAHTAEAQNRWSLNVRGDIAHATQKLGDADLDTGVGKSTAVDLSYLSAGVGLSWSF